MISVQQENFMNKIFKIILIGAVAGTIHTAVMALKSMNIRCILAVFIQWIITSLLIFNVSLSIQGWLKGLIIAEFCVLPLAILILHYDPAGSLISAVIIFGILGSVIGAYSETQ